MGIVQRQGIKGTIVSYIGAILGAITILFVYPYCMNTEEIGLFRLILDSAIFFGLLSLLGSGFGIAYFYPYYQNDEKRYNQFISFILLISFSGLLITIATFIFGKPLIIKMYEKNSPALIKYIYILIPIIFLNNIFSLIESHAQNLYRIVVHKFAREVVLRIVIIVLLFLFYFKILSFEQIIWTYIGALFIITISVLIYLITLSPYRFKLSFDFSVVNNKIEIVKYSLFVTLGIVGTVLSNRLDSFILSSTEHGLGKNGVYTTIVFMVMMIDLPIRTFLSISIPVVNEAIKNNDMDKIETLYKKSSIYLTVIAFIIFALLWCNIDSLFLIMPKGNQFVIAKYVLLILGISKIMDASTSINVHILSYSKYYKYSLVLSLILGALTIITAYILIPNFGLEGAAFATALSMACFQILQTTFVYTKFKKHPFSIDTFKVFLSFSLLIFIVYFLPNTQPVVTIIYKSLLIFIVSYLLIIKMKISKLVYDEIQSTVSIKIPSLAKFL
jgi:O-antigen/teichoic acid export membrane protein